MSRAYWRARNTINVLSRLLFRMEARGVENVPITGPLIIACNHISNLDPPLMGCWVPRQISYMAKKELFEIPLLGPAITAVGAYPVDREGSAKAAIKRSLDVLQGGGCIGIFPEGGRNVHGDKKPQTGVALLASLSGAPVLPACIEGTRKAYPFVTKIKVAYGRPLTLPEDRKATHDDLAKFTSDVMGAIEALRESIDGNSQS
jgi:1-acyl-sn-glycerol-3-phosphate acyltransferase